MGQRDIMAFLIKNKNKKFTTIEISEQMGVTPSNAMKACRKLRRMNLIKFQKTKDVNHMLFRYWVE